ncbi:PfkB family carbohydrate kinase [Nocardioides sp.]|uniref:PfkB family carbohydrate kinase n=1 Tax=Nocardioides sp. TaxID=35761 RepID=UPI0035149AF8
MDSTPVEASPSAPYALVVGESLVDVVTTRAGTVEHPGGSAANVAVALARLGRPVRFATSFADDDRGRAVATHLDRAGVVLATDPHVVARTSSAQATIGPDGAASYVFDLDWRLGPVTAVEDETPRVVHVCSLGAVLAPGAADVQALLDRLAAGTAPFVSYDVNARPAITGTGADVVAAVEDVARRAHLVKASDEDLEGLYPELGVDAAARHLLTLGPAAVVVTRGGDGASWFADADRTDIPGVPTTVVDTIGAGDTFSAGLLDALWDHVGARPGAGLADVDVAAVMGHAARAAAVTVSRPGADPPTRAELDAR